MMSIDPSSIDHILDMAEYALDSGHAAAALEFCDQVLSMHPGHAGALYLAAEAYRDLGELGEAEQIYRRVIQLTPEHSGSWSGLGLVLFDEFRLEESRAAMLRAIRLDPANPDAYYGRALLRERRGDNPGAARDFRRAFLLDPETFPLPVPLTDAMVEAVVDEVLLTLHPSVRSALSQVAIILEEFPDEEVCQSFEPPAPPGELLGYYSGMPISEIHGMTAWSALPSAIVLFRKNLERIAHDRDRMLEELRITLYHEVGHFLGLSEDDLRARGLE